MKTRTKKPSKANGSLSAGAEEPTTQATQLEESIRDPPQIYVLPKGVVDAARIVTLPHYNLANKACRFLFCPERGFFEFTSIADKQAYQSWLLTPTTSGRDDTIGPASNEADTEQAYILRDPGLMVATPIDPLYIILPLTVAADQACPGMYRTLSDILYDDATRAWQQLGLLGEARWRALQQLLEARMVDVCEVLRLGEDEDAQYRLSTNKLATYILSRAVSTVAITFPASLEERFVRQALEMPTHDVVADDEEVQTRDENTAQSSQAETNDRDSSQDSVNSSTTAASASTAATSISSSAERSTGASDEIKRLMRIRTTFDFMLRSYVPKSLQDGLGACLLACSAVVDFSPLLEYEKLLQSKKTEVQALRTLSENISRKRKLDDEEAADKAEEKRQKKEEEEARKKSMSHGVKKLMKADTSGMKKLSSFFTKKPAK